MMNSQIIIALQRFSASRCEVRWLARRRKLFDRTLPQRKTRYDMNKIQYAKESKDYLPYSYYIHNANSSIF
jgi:hypothetical protein